MMRISASVYSIWFMVYGLGLLLLNFISRPDPVVSAKPYSRVRKKRLAGARLSTWMPGRAGEHGTGDYIVAQASPKGQCAALCQ